MNLGAAMVATKVVLRHTEWTEFDSSNSLGRIATHGIVVASDYSIPTWPFLARA